MLAPGLASHRIGVELVDTQRLARICIGAICPPPAAPAPPRSRLCFFTCLAVRFRRLRLTAFVIFCGAEPSQASPWFVRAINELVASVQVANCTPPQPKGRVAPPGALHESCGTVDTQMEHLSRALALPLHPCSRNPFKLEGLVLPRMKMAYLLARSLVFGRASRR